MTYFELKKHIGKTLLPIAGDSSDYEAGKIIRYCADIDSAALFARLSERVPCDVEARALGMLLERTKRIPLEYITGRTDFFGLELEVTRDTLIPRADTERVCEKALALLRKGGRFADICCGSGNIALALLSRSDTRADLFDVSRRAADVAERNASRLGFADRASIFCRDVFSDDFFCGCEKYDVIISNPPYIDSGVIDGLPCEVKREPRIALDGGEDGMDFYRRLLDICPPMLKIGGAIVVEIGYDQGDKIEKLCRYHGFSCELFRDYGGNTRGCIIKTGI